MYKQKVLDAAKKWAKKGYQEGKNNDNIFGKHFKANFQPWCYYFVSYLMIVEAGMKIPPCGYVPEGYLWYKNKGRISPKPQEGDMVFFCWNKEIFKADKNSIGVPQHIGIVTKVFTNGTFLCVEGNTSSGRTGSQDNGDGVYEKLRRLSDVKGFGRPNYD